jgi:iron-sulfur cluster repair protein YtfE (RIC family)
MSSLRLTSQEMVRLLKQHDWLRSLLSGVEVAASEARSQGMPAMATLAVTIAQLGEALDEHNAAEESALDPLLREADAWGPDRVAQMIEHHHAEHAAFRAELRVLARERVPMRAATLVQRLSRDIRAHMDGEERDYLNPRVLRDDVIALDASGG